jgi:alanine racemase
VTFGARAVIRLGALKHNLGVIRDACPNSKLMAVVKANAYGHGLIPVAQNLPDVDAFAVARLPEAILLRESGVSQPIVLLAGVLSEHELRAAIENNCDIVVHCHEQIALLENHVGGKTTAWLKFDTGMNRLGFEPDEADALIAQLRACSAVSELRLMSHLASADEVGNLETQAQLDKFQSVVADFDGAVSIANSPAALGWPQLSGDHWIRTGIALFGVSPFDAQTGAELGLKPVMKFEARLIASKPLRKGARVGYKGSYTATADTTIGIISAGYGDGYTRQFKSGTPVLINGRQVPLIGNVSMDMITVDLGIDASDEVGDIATLWGPGLPVEEIAPWAGAIPYELVCGVMNREASEIID